MMTDTVVSPAVLSSIAKAKTILIVAGVRAGTETLASSLSLMLALKQAGKDVTLASSAELKAEHSRLYGLNEIQPEVGNRILTISFENYPFSQVEKIAHSEGGANRFELMLTPKPGFKPPQPDQVELSYKGVMADLVIVYDVNQLEQLGPIYESEQQFFMSTPILCLGRGLEPMYSATPLTHPTLSTSILTWQLIKTASLPVSDEIASNLMAGLEAASNRFQAASTSAEAFMTAAELLQAGAKRQPAPTSIPRPAAFEMGQGANPFFPQAMAAPNKTVNAPDDWLQPKIFKGSQPPLS